MSDKATKQLRALIERPERVQLWGQWYTRTPRLISKVFGDGELLVYVTPMATRPDTFLVRVDSKTKDLRDEPAPADSEIRARGGCDVSLIEEIMLAAEDEYGRFGIDEDGETMEEDDHRPFPVTDWGIGCSWGEPFPIAEFEPTPMKRRKRAAA